MQVKQISLLSAITLWAVLIGGVVYAHIVYFPAYLAHLPESNELIRGAYGIKDGNFWMIVHPLAIVATVTTLIFNWKQKQRRRLIGISATIYAVAIAATALYFLPGLFAFAESDTSGFPIAELREQAKTWERLSWLRGAGIFTGFFFLLVALTKTGEKPVVFNKNNAFQKKELIETMSFS